jgi:hypothetical protein
MRLAVVILQTMHAVSTPTALVAAAVDVGFITILYGVVTESSQT